MGVKSRTRMEKMRKMAEGLQFRAMQHMRGLSVGKEDPAYNPEQEQPWKERKIGTVVAMNLTGAFMAAERVRVNSEAPRLPGVVIVPLTIQNHQEWEKLATQQPDRPAIEAVAIEKKIA